MTSCPQKDCPYTDRDVCAMPGCPQRFKKFTAEGGDLPATVETREQRGRVSAVEAPQPFSLPGVTASAGNHGRRALPAASQLAGALCLGLFITPAAADMQRLDSSTVHLRDTENRGAVAEIHFDNKVGDGHRTGTSMLTHGPIVCSVEWVVGLAHPDSITVDCAGGYVAVPRTLTIEDGSEGLVFIYEGGVGA